MRASTKYTTAVHICIFLNHSEGEVQSSTAIAESVDTNPVVIRRLIQNLRNCDIIKSSSGAKGGFSLAKPANKITLWDIYLATRNDEFFKRPKINPDCVVSSNLKALVHDVFGDAEKTMKKVLENTTIAKLNNNLESILGKTAADTAIKKGK